MLHGPRPGEQLEKLARRLRLAEAPSQSLLDDIAAVCTRFGVLKQAGKLAAFDAWCKSGAWFDAALALVNSELPAWSVRRIVKDDGLWLCSLSRSPNIPIELDDGIEVAHESPPIAILLALIEAKRLGPATAPARPVASAADVGAGSVRMCCDNFA